MPGEVWLLTEAADVPEFSSRCSWFEPWYFKPEDSQHNKYSFSGFLRVFRSLGWIDLTVTSPLLLLFFFLFQSGGIQHWLSFVSGVYNNPSGFGPSVDLHKGETLWHMLTWAYTHSVTICENDLLWYIKWSVVHTILTSLENHHFVHFIYSRQQRFSFSTLK